MTFQSQSDPAGAADLAGFGYAQQLHRRLGSYASYAYLKRGNRIVPVAGEPALAAAHA
jgi:hypothetical protein